MKIHIFLLILNLVQLCFSFYINKTNTEYPSCPISAFRGKRALTEYTRWRANQVTKPEFIVKVDDDVLSPTVAAPKPVVAINVLPVTKAAEKIIIDAAINPTAKVVGPTTDVPLEYTRFVPPTTVRLTQVDDDLYLAPVKPKAIQLIKGLSMKRPSLSELAKKYPDRDDSPPASPQFISRTPTLLARQYAPITQVAFFPRTGIPPLTPPSVETSIPQRTTLIQPSRTSTMDDIIPTRTRSTLNSLDIFQPIVENANVLESLLAGPEIDDKPGIVTRRLISQVDFDETKVDTETTKLTTSEWNEVYEGLLKKGTLTTTDSAYHLMYFNDDDNELSNSRKQNVNFFEPKGKNEDESDVSKNEYEEDLKSTENVESENDIERLSSSSDIYSKNDNNDNELKDTFSDNGSTIVTTTFLSIEEESVSAEPVREKRRPVCNLVKQRDLSFKSPRTLPEIVAQLKRWSDQSPIAKWIDITDDNYTTMENPIYMMIVDDPTSGQRLTSKHTALIVAGIQGRDHHAVTAALYVLHQLIDRSEAHTDLLAKYRFWIIPVFNPDGYDYSMTFPQRREWAKNLRQTWEPCKGHESCSACETYGLRCTVQLCYGVNLDRNFEYQWIPTEELRAEHPCGSLYAGTRQLSEHETRALTHYLHDQRTPLHTFIAFKEGSVLRKRASRAASAAYSISGRPYVAGQTSQFLPLYAGGIEDWADGHLGIDNTYAIMMFRPSDSYDVKLITERVVHEAYAAMDTLLLQSIESLSRGPMRQVSNAASRISLHPLFTLKILLIRQVARIML